MSDPSRDLDFSKFSDEDLDRLCALIAARWSSDAMIASAAVFEQKLEDIALGKVEASHSQVLALFGVLKARDPKRWQTHADEKVTPTKEPPDGSSST